VSETDTFEWLPALLVLQGLLGAIDTLLNHELIERLPMRREARGELALHAGREAVYAALFLGLGWFAWLGGFAAAIALLLVAEVTITVTDELTENRIRVLPQNERALHVFLTLNFGAIIALAVPMLVDWSANPAELAPAHHGWMSWALTLFAVSSAGWALRDALASHRLKLRPGGGG
jgi:hypothetical protein